MKSKSTLISIALMLSLLFFSNLYLLQPGIWLYQDAAYWPKTSQEALMMINQQLHTFTNYGYYLGFDPGLFNFTRIEVHLLSGLLFRLFGPGGSQAVLSIVGSLVSFIAMYAMTKIFFKSKAVRFWLSLVYVFNPVMYSLQGHTYYGITIPLFIYSFYQFFKKESKSRLYYLLLNIVSVFFWVAYIRFVPINAIVVIPLTIYLLISKQIALTIKKLILFVVSYVLILSPILYSLGNQLIERSNTAFNYKFVYGHAVVKAEFFEAFNPFINLTIHLYTHSFYTIIGLGLSAFLGWLIWSHKQSDSSRFWLLNLSLILFGILCFGLANIFGTEGYKMIIQYFPFVINAPVFAFFITNIPLVLLLGKLTENRIKYLYLFAGIFLGIGIFPIVNLNHFELRQTDLNLIPESYQRYFINQSKELPEAAYYLPSVCWRSRYMDERNLPTGCFNFGLHYSSIFLGDPRLTSGLTYQLAKQVYGNTDVDNLRVTHNLKHIIVPNDIVLKNGPGSNTSSSDLELVNQSKTNFDKNKQLTKTSNENFNFYSYLNKDNYDFLLYAPRIIYPIEIDQWLKKAPIDIDSTPVFVEKIDQATIATLPAPTIWYKVDRNNPTTYYLKVTNITPFKNFMLQLNQTYHQSWQIKVISKEAFDNIKCKSDWNYFSITNNYRCLYQASLIDLDNLKFMWYPPVSSIHQTGNFLNNSWTINLPKEETYLVISYQKQEVYTIALVLATGVMVFLVLGILAQEVALRLNKND